MSFDGIVTKSIITELNKKILGGRINKIYQPENNELSINIYNKENYQLLISASSNYPRIGISQIKKENPMEPPMFCMLMRKHLIGGTIINIEQYYMDRIVFIDIDNYDELGNKLVLRLVVEIMGRHSNIILINKSNKKIIDSIHRVTEDISMYRQVLPGLTYDFPPLQDKDLIQDLDWESFYKNIKSEKPSLKIFKFFYMNYLGLSPLISKEICFRANIDINEKIADLGEEDFKKIYKVFNELCKDIVNQNFYPVIYKDAGKVKSFYCLKLKSFENSCEEIHLESMSEIIDMSYKNKNVSNKFSQEKSNLKKLVDTHLERTRNKLKKQEIELSTSIDRDKYRIYADVLSANFHQIEKGSDLAILDNFYSENLDKIEIPLDSKISPPQNADKYYKTYSKLKNAEIRLKKYIPVSKHEISYLENVLMNINYAEDLDDLYEIKEELISQAYIQKKNNNKNKRKNKISKPHHYLSSDGYDIFVGKNNRQNDELTIRTAKKKDLWLHVQNIPGSHVIVKKNPDDNLPDKTLEEAALLAAYYSQARNSKNIAVDYTLRQNVNKARGSKPGMVYYNDFKTIFVSPSLYLIEKIKKID